MLARLVMGGLLLSILNCAGDDGATPRATSPASQPESTEVRPTDSPQLNPNLSPAVPALNLTPIGEPLILRQRWAQPWDEVPGGGIIREIGSYVFELDSGKLLALSWSNDIGDRGGYIAGRRGDATYVADLVRSGGLQVADGATRLMDWSADGESFLARAGLEALYLIARDGSHAELVITGIVRDAAWRPGANAFAYEADGGIFLLDLAAGSPREILPASDGQPDATFRGWSRDGKWLLVNFNGAPHVVDVDAGESFELGACCFYMEWSPVDNSLLVGRYLQRGAEGEVFVLEEGDLTDAAKVLSGEPIADGLRPSWSPDGSSIAFLASGCTTDWTLHLISREGGDMRTPGGQSNVQKYQFDWSPNGRYIAYAAYPVRGGNESGGEILVLDLESGEERTIARSERAPGASGPTMRGPEFSEDGRWLLFDASGGFGVCLG
jgi:WD40 repeat protein